MKRTLALVATLAALLPLTCKAAQVGGEQINRNWTFNLGSAGTSAVGLVISGTSGQNARPAYRILSPSGGVGFEARINGQTYQSGGLLINLGGVSGTGVTIDAGVALEVIGTASGRDLFATRSITGTYLSVSKTFNGAGLSSCSGAGQKLLWSSTTKQFSCSTDLNSVFGTGNVLTIGDARYLKLSGGTLTGVTTISITGGGVGTLGFKILNTTSGAVIHAERALTSSGTIAAVGGISTKGGLSGETLIVSGASSFSGTMILSKALKVRAAMSGSSLTIDNLHSCTNVQTNAGGTASCNSSAYQTTALTDDNVWVGSSGNLAAAIALPSCSNGSTHALEYNTGTNAFSCVAITGTTYYAGQGLTNTSNSLKVNATLTGSVHKVSTTLSSSGTLNVDGLSFFKSTLSGARLHIEQTIAASGSIVSKKTLSGAGLIVSGASSFSGTIITSTNLWSKGTLSGKLLIIGGAASISGTLLVKGNLTSKSTISGSTVTFNTASGYLLRSNQISPREMQAQVVASGSALAVGSGKLLVEIPLSMSGYYLTNVYAKVQTAGTTNATTFRIVNRDKGSRQLLSTVMSIDSGTKRSDQAGTPVVISRANADVSAYDILDLQIASVSTTAPKGLNVILVFAKP